MRIMIRSGRILEGTPLDIVRRMQRDTVLTPMRLSEYIDWSVANTFTFEGLVLTVSGVGDARRAASLLNELLARGLAVEDSPAA